jgi:hypothetical protein
MYAYIVSIFQQDKIDEQSIYIYSSMNKNPILNIRKI